MNRDYLKDTGERMLRAFAAAAVPTLGIADHFNVFRADWPLIIGTGLGGAVVSLLFSLLAIKVGNHGTASLTDATVTTSYADAVAHGRHAAGLKDGPA